MRLIRTVLWHSPNIPSMERFTLFDGNAFKHLEGTVLAIADKEPVEIRYILTCDPAWKARGCIVRVETGEITRKTDLRIDNGGLLIRDEVPAINPGKVSYIDLGFTPSTNTLPIRSLHLTIGQSVHLTAGVLKFPGFDLVHEEHVYTRLSDGSYRFESGNFSAELEVDRAGIVTKYGDLWQEIPPGEPVPLSSG